ncbi:MAG TPA: hypothetical protein VGL77_21325 [Armatimonadota bacterium]|jgi:hypothetical protein
MVNRHRGRTNEEWLKVIMEEYRSIRQESLDAMKLQQSVLNFGVAALAALFAAAFNLWDRYPFLAEMVFFWLIPPICSIALIIWVGEVARMMRAGIYLTELEEKINAAFGYNQRHVFGDPLGWENWLRQENRQLAWNYKAIIAFFLLAAFAAVLFGVINYLTKIPTSPCYHTCIAVIIEFFFVISVARFVYLQGKKFS